jgi:membrane protease YdiL (CAAX protease family)
VARVGLEKASIVTTKMVLVINELILLSLAAFFFTKIFTRTFSELGLTARKLVHNAVLGLLVGVGGWFGAVVVAAILAILVPYKVPEWFAKMLTATSSLDLLYFLILTWVLVGPCEELFFRGFIQGTFTTWKGPVAGLIAGSTLFGLAHFNPLLWFRTIPSAFLGFVYGIVYAKRRSIIPVAVAHSLNDTIGFVLTFFMASI